ncbi:IS110 family transposase [Clostridium formicaceticum]|uniref:IS110 family transposase n=1 Tax=Clostridium formicaceticum TaxID=1497 RepID=A0AAC9RIW4_9CLOT|nr:IS110 family transposase [Clostridium formicaceticum]AOY76021.1 IS110 family transposase [Clostridium formicaceticum]ARE86379.1 Transposase IS116/IS110/IS902 family protein [Clostridium formicaceticum]
MHKKQNYIYIGVDTHKHSHTAVIINCWEDILEEITFEARPSIYPDVLKKVKKHCKGLTPVFGLEDVKGYGRSLAVYLLENKQIVKEVNSALSYAERKSAPTTQKNDNYDAFCVASVLLRRLDRLPDANPQDIYWTIGQLVNRRSALVKAMTSLANQLHEQLSCHYPSYKKLFAVVDGKTALEFWEQYPAPYLLDNITPEDLAEFLRKHSHNACSTNKAQKILDTVKADGDTKRGYQDSRNVIVRSIVRDIKFKKQEIQAIEKELKEILKVLDYKLESMPGINTVTASSLIAQIGDIHRFTSPDKLARYAGIAPVKFSSAGKGKEQSSKQGDRTLFGLFYVLAWQHIQTAKGSGKPRNPVSYAYYQKKLKEGKTKVQALVCLMRVLVVVIYGMMKNKTEYNPPALPENIAV